MPSTPNNDTATDFNPTFETCGVKMRLTEICHDAGLRNRVMKGTVDSYYDGYYATLRKLMPDHPALAYYDAKP